MENVHNRQCNYDKTFQGAVSAYACEIAQLARFEILNFFQYSKQSQTCCVAGCSLIGSQFHTIAGLISSSLRTLDLTLCELTDAAVTELFENKQLRLEALLLNNNLLGDKSALNFAQYCQRFVLWFSYIRLFFTCLFAISELES